MSDNDKRVSNPADIPVLDEVLVPGKPAEAAPVPDDDLDDLLDECADELGDEFDISDDLPDDAPAEDTPAAELDFDVSWSAAPAKAEEAPVLTDIAEAPSTTAKTPGDCEIPEELIERLAAKLAESLSEPMSLKLQEELQGAINKAVYDVMLRMADKLESAVRDKLPELLEEARLQRKADSTPDVEGFDLDDFDLDPPK